MPFLKQKLLEVLAELGKGFSTLGREFGPWASKGRQAAEGVWKKADARQRKIVVGIIAAVFLVCLVSMVAAIAGSGNPQRAAQLDPDEKMYLHVKQGMTSGEIGTELEKHGVIESHTKFWFIAKINGYDNQIKTGMYELHPGMDPRDVLQKLVAGETTRIKFTIPEGFRIRDIAKRLGDAGIVDEKEFLKKAENYRPYDYVEKHDGTFYACEGFLFPDTYVLRSDYDVDSILKEMSSDFDQRLTPKLRARAKQMNLSIYELVTLASLVEKEAKFEEDRPKVAQVFLKRLKIGMPLQSDTTFQYLRDDPKEDLSLADTKVDSPYNTYQNKGLPPGPIASPGMAAIEAVLYPADTDYLYFVADRDGHNHYSTNYADHEAIVEEVR